MTAQKTTLEDIGYIVYDAPSNSLAFGRGTLTTPSGTGRQWAYLGYTINYTTGCGEPNMACGEPEAACGNYDKFVTYP